jgi:amyloid beta precursor protein binding protein 1
LTDTGIGAFTILDGKIADGEDAGVNFFLEEESIGQPRGEAACRLISELNPGVEGDFRVANPETVISESPEFFRQYSIVIATQLSEKAMLGLSKILWEHNIPLILVKSIGFIGSFRIVIPEITSIALYCEC